jgi:hypothetical protein
MQTYSFTDCSLVLSHPSLGMLTVIGKGIGSISINMTGDRTAMDVAADGRVMVSKIKDRRATATVQILQASEVNRDLLKWYNYLETAPASEWAAASGVLNAPVTGEQIVMTDIAFQKLPDRSYGAQGNQQQTWNLMIADCQQNTI